MLSCASRALSIWVTVLLIHSALTLSNSTSCNAFQFRLGLSPRPMLASLCNKSKGTRASHDPSVGASSTVCTLYWSSAGEVSSVGGRVHVLLHPTAESRAEQHPHRLIPHCNMLIIPKCTTGSCSSRNSLATNECIKLPALTCWTALTCWGPNSRSYRKTRHMSIDAYAYAEYSTNTHDHCTSHSYCGWRSTVSLSSTLLNALSS